MSTTLLNLKPPEEITSLKVRCYWERMAERIWAPGYTVYRSPNKELKAIVNDATGQIGLMYFKWCNSSVHVNEVLPLLIHLWEVAGYTVRNTRSRRRPKNTYWITLRRRDASTPLQPIPMLLREAAHD